MSEVPLGSWSLTTLTGIIMFHWVSGCRLPVGNGHVCVTCLLHYSARRLLNITEQPCARLLLDKIKILTVFLTCFFSSPLHGSSLPALCPRPWEPSCLLLYSPGPSGTLPPALSLPFFPWLYCAQALFLHHDYFVSVSFSDLLSAHCPLEKI